MAIIASIAAAFSLNTAQFRDEVKRARSSLRAFEKGIKKTFGALKKFVKDSLKSIFSLKGAFATLAGSAGIGLLVASSLNAVDTLGKTSDKLNATTEGLVSLRLAAQLSSNMLSQQFDTALQRMTRRVAEAASGAGEAQAAIKELRLDAGLLNQLTADQVFTKIAEAMQGVEGQSNRLRIAFKLFDSEGAGLVNTLNLGRDGLEKIRREADALGITMSRDAVAGVEDANESITKLGLLFKGLRDQTVSALAPAIAKVVTNIKDFIIQTASARGGIRNLAKDMAVNIIEGAKLALSGIEVLVKGFDEVKKFLFDIGYLQDKEIEKLKEQRAAAYQLFRQRNINMEQLERMRAHIDSQITATQKATITQEGEISIFDRARASLDALTESIGKNIAAKNSAAVTQQQPASVGVLNTITAPDNVGPGLDTSAAERIEQLKQSFMSEEELLKNSLIEKQLLIDEAWKTQQIKTSERNQLLLDIQEDYHRQLAQIEREKQQQTLSSTASIFGSLASIVGQGSKKAFEQAKKFARAETLISTYAAAQKAFHATIIPGDPTSVGRAYLAAAAAVSAGLSRLVAINRTSFGSSSAAASNTGSGSFTTGPGSGPTTPNQSSNTSSPQQQTVIFWVGGRNGPPSSDEFRGFVQQLRSAINNDGLVLADRNSQQAYELLEVLSGVG